MPSVSTQTCSSDNERLVVSSHTQLPDPQSAPQFHLPLPWNYEKTRQYWWYGYNVGHDWLIQYAKQRDVHPDPNDSDLTLLIYARDSLSSYTGIKALAIGTAIRDESVPQDAALSFDGHVSILAICSSRRESYYNQPTQAQVDKLTQILGCEPRWWIDERNPLQYGPVDPVKLSTSSNQVESSEGLAVSSNPESGPHRISVSRPANYKTISRFYCLFESYLTACLTRGTTRQRLADFKSVSISGSGSWVPICAESPKKGLCINCVQPHSACHCIASHCASTQNFGE